MSKTLVTARVSVGGYKMPKYNPKYWFDDIPVIGKMTPSEAARKLQEIGEVDSGVKVTRGRGERRWGWSDKPEPWQYTSHTFGFIPVSNLNAAHAVEIKHSFDWVRHTPIHPPRVKITLDRLR